MGEHEISRFYDVHPIGTLPHTPIGTLPHTAVTLMLYTGAARVDPVSLGWGNIEGGRLLVAGEDVGLS